MESSRLEALMSMLQPGNWQRCNDTMGVPSAPYILSRFPVLQHFRPLQNIKSVGCRVSIDNRNTDNDLAVNLWNVHLLAEPYGPYEACYNQYAKNDWDLSEVCLQISDKNCSLRYILKWLFILFYTHKMLYFHFKNSN